MDDFGKCVGKSGVALVDLPRLGCALAVGCGFIIGCGGAIGGAIGGGGGGVILFTAGVAS
ncbi:hypothetical protein VCCP1040_1521 [Vibrio cholerae CP1040(13)]|nr:hypothetical protein VCCP1040_1521 [Vibrio cholerae CP1040(13)]